MEAYSRTSSQNQSQSSVLHSVRKSNSKPWKKASVAPPPPAAIRVYEVDVMNFRELVQQLTGAPDQSKTHQQFVQNVAPAAGREKLQALLELNLSSTSSYSWASSLP